MVRLLSPDLEITSNLGKPEEPLPQGTHRNPGDTDNYLGVTDSLQR